MPTGVPPVADERENLLGYLAFQRFSFRAVAHGLTDEQARLSPISSSTLSIGGLVKHSALTERSWMVRTVARREPHPPMDEATIAAWGDGHRLLPDETLAQIIGLQASVAAETEEIVAGYADLGHPVPVPRGVPWFPSDVENWSVRWVLLHLIEEQARHLGHADLIREAIDGKTMYELMAEYDQHQAGSGSA